MNWRRMVIAVILGELVPILVLVGAVALWGPRDPAAAELYARQLGSWLGPLAGALTLLAAGFWAGKASLKPVLQGAVIGLIVAGIDFSILFSTGEPFRWLFAISNVGKVLAGALGGWLAWSSAPRNVGPADLA